MEIVGQGWFLGKTNTKIRSGYGVMLYDCGLYYIGVWQDNFRHGMGFMIASDGAFYKGEWVNDMPAGYGEYKDGNLEWTYKGMWRNGKKEEQGTEIFPDNTKFIGGFHENLKDGRGKFFFDKKCHYVGNFQKDVAYGPNCIQKAEDYTYEGPFDNNTFHGAGKVTYFDRFGKPTEKYIGQFHEGIKHGYGEYTWANGSSYRGSWKDGLIANKGVFIEGN